MSLSIRGWLYLIAATDTCRAVTQDNFHPRSLFVVWGEVEAGAETSVRVGWVVAALRWVLHRAGERLSCSAESAVLGGDGNCLKCTKIFGYNASVNKPVFSKVSL